MLSIISHESGGLQAQRTCKPGKLPRLDGSEVEVNRALGLTQCIPATVAWYNTTCPESERATLDDMQGASERAARLQIRVGALLLKTNIKALNRYDPVAYQSASAANATPEHLSQALIAYAIGIGALREKLDGLKQRGLSLTQKNLFEQYPTWGKNQQGIWINQPLRYAQTVYGAFEKHRSGASTPAPADPRNPIAIPGVDEKKNTLLIGIVLVVASLLIKRFLSQRQNQNEA